MKISVKLLFALLIPCASLSADAQTKNPYHIVKNYPIHSSGRWDYITVDPDAHRLYVSHGTQVNILNENTGDSTGVILHTDGVHGIAIVNSLMKGYVSNGKLNTVSVFNLQNNQVLTEIKTGENPDDIFYDDFSKKVFAFDGKSHQATVIDPKTDKVIATIELGGKPEAGVSDGKGKVFVNIENTNEIVQIGANTLKVENRYKLGGGEEPSGLAIDRKTNRLFTGCANKLMLVLDAQTGKTITKLPIGEDCDGVAFDPGLNIAYSSNGDGTLTAVKEVTPDKFTVLENIKTEQGARTLAVDLKTHHIFLPTAYFKENTEPGKRPVMIPGSFHVLEVGMK